LLRDASLLGTTYCDLYMDAGDRHGMDWNGRHDWSHGTVSVYQ